MKYLKIIIIFIAAIALATSTTFAVITHQRNHDLQDRVEQQSAVIDSLLARRMKVFDVNMYVTDNSNNKIYGRYNKGEINMPQEKIYRLELDSMSVMEK